VEADPVLGVSYDVINPTGTRTMVLIGGGTIIDPEILVQPLGDHRDYEGFIQNATAKHWRILVVHGQDTLSAYYDKILELAQGSLNKEKPILVGHSAGAVVCLDYAKDRPHESWFERIVLFNCPLIYPTADKPALRSCYISTDLITAQVELIMSKNDDVLMPLSLQNITMAQAIDRVQQTGKVHVRVLDQPDYKHSPFSPCNVAWNTVGQIPVPALAIHIRVGLGFRGFLSRLHAWWDSWRLARKKHD
jgi:pimeloyl-ACP methyl ester carboxylesterase